MAEWFKAPVLKTGMGRKAHRGFESLSLRLIYPHWGGAREADWARLLSECWGKTQPRVRIPPSPPIKVAQYAFLLMIKRPNLKSL